MESPKKTSSFEVWINRFDTSEGVISLNGLSKNSRIVEAFDEELTHQQLHHEQSVDDNGEVTFRVHFSTMEQVEPRYDWPILASLLGRTANQQEVDAGIVIRDPGRVTDNRATEIPILRN